MPSFERHPDYRNILLVYGNEIDPAGDNRPLLKNFLYGQNMSPVRQGTHDFWITFVFDSRQGENHAYEDISISRPLRGIIHMADIPDDLSHHESPNAPSNLQAKLATLTQEWGHHWLVPFDLLLRNLSFWPSPAGACNLPLTENVSLLINDGSDFYGSLLLGRTNNHWSSFFQGDASALDGIYWNQIAADQGYDVWEQSNVPASSLPSAEVPTSALGGIQLIQQYNDLDLLVMGVKTADEAYHVSRNQFNWMEPRYAAPLDYLAGLFVVFSRYDFFYFGFYRDQRNLGVAQSGSNVTEFTVPNYSPLESEFSNMALRIIRRNNDYYFQAQLDNPRGSELNARLLRNIDPLPLQPDATGASFEQFHTIDIRTHIATPIAIGFIVKTWHTATMCDAAFMNLEILDGSAEYVLNTDVLPPLWRSSPSSPDYSSLRNDSLVYDRPAEGPLLRTEQSRLHIVVPFLSIRDTGRQWPENNTVEIIGFENPFNHWISSDSAPKIITKAPIGNDFAFASSAKIHRSVFTPWAGGYAVGKTMWGRSRTALTGNVVLNDRMHRKQESPAISSGDAPYTYKTAFIVMARQRSDFFNPPGSIKIENANLIRQYWDAAFDVLTLNCRHSDSTL